MVVSLGKILNIYLSNLERWKRHFRDKITKNFYCRERCNAKLNYLKFIAINRTIQPLLDWIGLDWNALFHVDKIVEKKHQINECIIQVLLISIDMSN